MNLNELLELLRDASILDDDRCTVRAVSSFFVLVNIDDECLETDGGPRGNDQRHAPRAQLPVHSVHGAPLRSLVAVRGCHRQRQG